ncbi:MAG: hypothetical protein HC936_08165 [Leptolyngbyaceae cyanobacterium SU_3_3]|nr:hypothetical protein [Leptolyngbyaceae cyanobacterium SU_3_3]
MQNRDGQYDGLRRIAAALPESTDLPLIILVDQFEEVYTLCSRPEEQNIFISNLLHAANDPAQQVSVIITMRSDFLAETQHYSQLNELFSTQGYLVPAMNAKNMRLAISEPAKQAGYKLTEAAVSLLVEQAIGRDGVLPLLQFTLSQVWIGLQEGKDPDVTLRDLGGVGGALSKEAQRIYDGLSEIPRGQAIAKRVFVGLVDEKGTQNTRHRVALYKLRSHKDDPKAFRQVIERFSDRGVRLITLSGEIGSSEMVEVTHEALFNHWNLLSQWLEHKRNDRPFERRLESAATHWNQMHRPEGLLWRSPDLDLLADFVRRSNDDMTPEQMEFFQASNQAEIHEQQQKRQRERQKIIFLSVLSALFGVIAILLFWFYLQQSQAQKTIEAVFLGSDTENILKALPDLEKSASKLRDEVETPQTSDNPDKYYRQKKVEINKLFAYYRNILTETGRLGQENQQYKNQLQPIADRTEKALAELISKYRISQLKSDLKQNNFGKYFKEKSVTNFQNQYSGALRTTYEILFTTSGAGADLNKDGFVGDPQEAAQMPCQTLKEIEELWRKATDEKCGWYNRDGYYANDKDCKKLSADRGTLYASIFGHNTDDAINRIKQCGIPPR